MSKPHVFLSYIQENWDTVRRLADALKTYEIEVWLDRERIAPGLRWESAIRDAIRNGAYFVACFSDEYTKRTRTYMNLEIIIAIEELQLRPFNRAWFIPVLLSKCEVPDRDIGAGETLRSIQWVDLSENWSDGVHRILSVIQPISSRVHELIQALTDKSIEVRLKTVDDLGKIGMAAKSAAPALLELLEQEDETLRTAAINTLNSLGVSSYEIVSKLASAIDKNAKSYGWDDYSPTLARMGETAVPAMIQELGKPHKHDKFGGILRRSIVHVGIPALPALIDALSNADRDIKYGVILTLLGFGKSAKPAMNAVLQQLNDLDAYTKAFAIDLLGSIGDPAAIPALIALDTSDLRDIDEESRLATALGEIGDPVAVPFLIKILNDQSKEVWRDPDGGVRSRHDLYHLMCTSALSKIGDHGAVDALITILQDEGNDSHLRGYAAKALGMIGEGAKTALPLLFNIVETDDLDLRFCAAVAIWRIEGDPKIVIPIAAKRLTHQNAVERQSALFVLRDIGPDAIDSVPELMRALEHDANNVRHRDGFAVRDLIVDVLKSIDPNLGDVV